LREYSGVHVVEHDLSVRRADWHQQFHVVRAANILHRDYFNDETLRGMLAHLQSYLIDGGLLLVARTTDDGVNTATLFRKRGGQTPELVGRFGTGSDIEALALTVPAPTA
jgi:chemotaxis methyl-accepting protein methylase